MSLIEEKTILKIKIYGGCIEIPFISLELLDEFTVRYKDRDELVNALFSMLNFSIDRRYIMDVFVYYEYEKNGQIRSKNARVKYSEHNFDKARLVEFVKDFLNNNHDMIKYCGVRKIRSKGMYEFLSGYRDILKYEIDYAVLKYFDGAPYGVYRKNYFFLIENGVKPSVKKVLPGNNRERFLNNSKFYINDDSEDELTLYVQSIIRALRNGSLSEEAFYEELSRIDPRELKRILTVNHFNLFDGMENDKPYTIEDLYDLEQCTGIDINDLCNYVAGFKKGHKR